MQDNNIPWGIPQELRAKLLNEDDGTFSHVARILDTLNYLGYQPDDLITEPQLVKALKEFHIDKKTIRNVLKSILTTETDSKRVFQSITRNDFVHQDDGSVVFTLNFQHIVVKEGVITKYKKNAGKKGRPLKWYVIPRVSDLWAMYQLGDTERHYLCLKEADLSSISQYRRSIQREIIRIDPGKHYRSEFSENTGVSTRTTYNYDKRIGTEIQANYREEIVTRDTIDWYLENIPYGSLMSSRTGDEKFPATKELFTVLQGTGVKVYYHFRTANDYRLPAGKYEPAKYIRRDKNKYEVITSD